MELKDRVALVTGGRRIGAVVAEELAKRGADIALSYNRSHDEAEEAASAIRRVGRRAVTVQVDLSRHEGAATLVSESVKALGRLDVLINMASVYKPHPFDVLGPVEFEENLRVDLTAAFLCSRAAVPHMRAAGGGRIINFSDWLAYSHRPRYRGYLPYYVAKAAIIALTEALALELADDRILVNAVAPGPILPPPEVDEDEFKAVEKATPLGRWGGELEIAKVVIALVGSDFITGETIRVDGGRHIK